MPTLLKRLKQRGRDYELAYYTQDYLMQLESGLNALIQRLSVDGLRVLEIPETHVNDFVVYSEDKERLIDLVNTACLS